MQDHKNDNLELLKQEYDYDHLDVDPSPFNVVRPEVAPKRKPLALESPAAQ